MALAARWFFGNPGDNMTKVGITGTKGKTTVTFVMKDILDKYTDNRCSAFSTHEIDVGTKVLRPLSPHLSLLNSRHTSTWL